MDTYKYRNGKLTKRRIITHQRVVAALCVVFTVLAFSNIQLFRDHVPGLSHIPQIPGPWKHPKNPPPIAKGKTPRPGKGNPHNRNDAAPHKSMVTPHSVSQSPHGTVLASGQRHSASQTAPHHTVADGGSRSSSGSTSGGSQSNGNGSNGNPGSGGQPTAPSPPRTPIASATVTARPLIGVNASVGNGVNLGATVGPIGIKASLLSTPSTPAPTPESSPTPLDTKTP